MATQDDAVEFLALIRAPILEVYKLDEAADAKSDGSGYENLEENVEILMNQSWQAMELMEQKIPNAKSEMLILLKDANPLVRFYTAAALEDSHPLEAYQTYVDLAEMDERVLPNGRADYHYRSIQGRAAMTLWFMLDGKVEDWPHAPDEFWRDPKYASKFIGP
jgi:hypothetical protein